MKQKDIKIIHELRNNARLPLTNMSRKTRIPVSTLYDRIQVQRTVCLKGFTSLIDFAKLGFKHHLFILAKAFDKQSLLDFLQLNPNVNTIFKIGNGGDVAVECIFENKKAFDSFENRLPGLIISSSKITNEIKHEGFFA